MPSKGAFYGVVLVLAAMVVISSTLAAIYYLDYQQQVSENQRDVSELSAALSSYATVQSSLNSSLAGYNTTLRLLADSVANLNTSTPSYMKASVALASLWGEYQALVRNEGRTAPVFSVDMLVDYGNGTRVWYNDSSAQPGWNAYVTTLVLLNGSLQAVWYPQYGEHFVTGVDGVPQTQTQSWFVWDRGPGGWEVAPSGADGIEVGNGTVIAWTLCGYDADFSPSCHP